MSGPRARALTGPGQGGIAVVSVCGPGALERVRALCPGARLRTGSLVPSHLLDGAESIDEVLVLVLSEQEVELHLHGNPRLVARALDLLGGGESRAQVGSLEERAARLGAAAPGEAGARILLDQSEGALRRELAELIDLAPREQDARLAALLERGRAARYALRPARIVLAGPPNAGKSTLFNALCGSERVVVSAEAGTTRDLVLERARLGSWPVDLADAPGERPRVEGCAGGVALERAGAELARDLAETADLVFWLSPACAPQEPPSGEPHWVRITSQADLLDPDERAGRAPWISAREDAAAAAELVARLFRARLGLPDDPWQPGAAVPFEPDQLAHLERALHARGGARARELARLQEPVSAPGS